MDLLSQGLLPKCLRHLETNEDELSSLCSHLKPFLLPDACTSIFKLSPLSLPSHPYLEQILFFSHLKSFKKITTLEVHLSVSIKLDI